MSITNNATSTGGIDKNGGPNLFSNPAAIVTAAGEPQGQYGLFQETFAGQSGLRDNIRGPGLFNIDTGLYKTFSMPYNENHKLKIAWDSFNVTNSVRFNGPSLVDNAATTFGRFATTLTQPRQMQFSMRYSF